MCECDTEENGLWWWSIVSEKNYTPFSYIVNNSNYNMHQSTTVVSYLPDQKHSIHILIISLLSTCLHALDVYSTLFPLPHTKPDHIHFGVVIIVKEIVKRCSLIVCSKIFERQKLSKLRSNAPFNCSSVLE